MKSAIRLGYYSSIATFILTVLTFAIAFFTPPFSGPFCQKNCFFYPYTDIASRFPRDYYWMFPAIFLFIAFYVLMSCLHYSAPKAKKIFSHLALSSAFLSVSIFLVDYFLQLSVVQPSLLKGEYDGISLLSQFNPHGIFIVLEEIAFLLLSLSLFLTLPFFSNNRGLRIVFSLNFFLNILAFVLFNVIYGVNREYRFEVTTISLNWLTLIISGLLLASYFKNRLKSRA